MEGASQCADLLFELGTEELPPVALKRLSDALTWAFVEGLQRANLQHGPVHAYATPRRLALWVEACATAQPDRATERRGPAVQAAFDAEGNPTRAAQGFARSCNTGVDQLERLTTDKGEWLVYNFQELGKPTAELLPGIAEEALNRLPIPKRMRWGASEAQFVRPVQWLLFLLGEQVVPCRLLDTEAGNLTHGHRFHHPQALRIEHPAQYAEVLREQGRVIADFAQRREKIRRQVAQTADAIGGHAPIDEALLDEVTGLVEWPVPISAGFEERFLEVPHEALISTMKKNQKYFHLVDAQGRLMNHFITIANIDSPKPELIKEGNERVVRPRLSDAMFFWQQDGKRTLDSRIDSLKGVLFQQKLGSMHDKSVRVAALAGVIAGHIGGDRAAAEKAGMLSRCDLMTEMVYEFPEMQGIMGRYQAKRDGESDEIAQALDEFYMPRFSGDDLPRTRTGIAVSLAERLDTLVGIFGIGMKPTGDKDPFALRRAALGALRIMREHSLALDLRQLLEYAVEQLRPAITEPDCAEEVYGFMLERLKGIYLDQQIAVDLFEAVAAIRPDSIADFDRRVQAVVAFRTLTAADALAAANKRIHNILKKSAQAIPPEVDPDLFDSPQEQTLYSVIEQKRNEIAPLMADAAYEQVLQSLATLQAPVDQFFDQVMVMADNPAIRTNRLALLNRLNKLFLGVADISILQS
ncbi:glycine--tRNA ligase subunit beta [Sedimenticola hydrogenitrophicus]|uniref:glycine--tRNA ligase subunit beta n=1 Tax=Sedimenticola hydrogenitrophicus TaxID=2967975 RepID=UPI0021A31B42|nr:glycine--tRNA ligase subunit beta [Sedimenticola hydrogenitrophicus]